MPLTLGFTRPLPGWQRLEQHHRVRGDALAPAGEAEALGRGGLHVHPVHARTEVGGDIGAHRLDMGRHARALGDDRDIGIAQPVALAQHQRHAGAQQFAAVGALEARIGVGEVPADVAGRDGAEQRVAQCVQRHVAVRMRDEPVRVRDAHAAEHHRLARLRSGARRSRARSSCPDPATARKIVVRQFHVFRDRHLDVVGASRQQPRREPETLDRHGFVGDRRRRRRAPRAAPAPARRSGTPAASAHATARCDPRSRTRAVRHRRA